MINFLLDGKKHLQIEKTGNKQRNGNKPNEIETFIKKLEDIKNKIKKKKEKPFPKATITSKL